MFQLIVSIIAIALVAVLAAASVFYGGDAFTSGTAKANASATINTAQQVAAAWTLYRTDTGGVDPTLGALAAANPLVAQKYIASVPGLPANVSALTLVADLGNGSPGVTVSVSDSGICGSIQKSATGSSTIGATLPTTQSYGCYGASSPYTGFYKR